MAGASTANARAESPASAFVGTVMPKSDSSAGLQAEALMSNSMVRAALPADGGEQWRAGCRVPHHKRFGLIAAAHGGNAGVIKVWGWPGD